MVFGTVSRVCYTNRQGWPQSCKLAPRILAKRSPFQTLQREEGVKWHQPWLIHWTGWKGLGAGMELRLWVSPPSQWPGTAAPRTWILLLKRTKDQTEVKTEVEKSCSFTTTEEPMSQKLKELPSLYFRKQYSQIYRDKDLENRKNISYSPVISIPLLKYLFLGFFFLRHFFVCFCFKYTYYKNKGSVGISLLIQWLGLHTPNARGPDSIPGQGARSHMSQLKIPACCN